MREITLEEINSVRSILCAMIEVAVFDSRNFQKFKNHYKQRDVDNSRESATAWINDEMESNIKFSEICDALGLDKEWMRERINPICKKNILNGAAPSAE